MSVRRRSRRHGTAGRSGPRPPVLRSIRTRLAVTFFLVTFLSVAVIYVIVAPPLTSALQHEGVTNLRNLVDTSYQALPQVYNELRKVPTEFTLKEQKAQSRADRTAQDLAQTLAGATLASQVTIAYFQSSGSGAAAPIPLAIAGYPDTSVSSPLNQAAASFALNVQAGNVPPSDTVPMVIGGPHGTLGVVGVGLSKPGGRPSAPPDSIEAWRTFICTVTLTMLGARAHRCRWPARSRRGGVAPLSWHLDDRSTSLSSLFSRSRRRASGEGRCEQFIGRRCGPVPLGRAVEQVWGSTAIVTMVDPEAVAVVVETGLLGNRLLVHVNELPASKRRGDRCDHAHDHRETEDEEQGILERRADEVGEKGAAGDGGSLRRRQTMRIDGKVVLITGASEGIGAACAREFASSGARLSLTARHEEGLRRAALGGLRFARMR